MRSQSPAIRNLRSKSCPAIRLLIYIATFLNFPDREREAGQCSAIHIDVKPPTRPCGSRKFIFQLRERVARFTFR